MKVIKMPKKVEALLFDMDLTLYSSPDYAQYQTDSLVKRLGEKKGISYDEINAQVEEARKAWIESHEGKKPSLTAILMTFGVTMEENIRWREEEYAPEKFIKEDIKLKQTLEALSHNFSLGVVTNNSVFTARRTLAALGVEACFPILVGLDTCMVSKPHHKPFLKFIELASCQSETCVSIGDRYDIDLDIPLEIGMGAILVDGVEDVYHLPEVLMEKY